MSAPERIWAAVTPNGRYIWWKAEKIGALPYILATPEALAAAPEVQELIAAEREACAAIADEYHTAALEWAKGVRGLEKLVTETDSSRIAAAIRNRKETT